VSRMSDPLDMEQFVTAVAEALGRPVDPVPLHVPTLVGRCRAYVSQCVDTGWVSSAGAFVSRFEKDLAELLGAAEVVALVNGTCALELALRVGGIGAGDEVVCPSLTFVATANAIHHAGATPHFVDSQPHPLGLDPDALEDRLNDIAEVRDGECFNRETGKRIAAAVPVHLMGQAAHIDAILAVCERFGVTVIEDAAEALGCVHRDRGLGRFGKAGILSFNGNKIVSTGGGGAIVTDDRELAARARHLSQTAKQPHPWAAVHDAVGFNYRLPNINAALGCAQLEYLEELLVAKRALAQEYARWLEPIDGLCLLGLGLEQTSNAWLNTVLLDDPPAEGLSTLIDKLHNAGILARPIWTPMHQLPMYAQCPRGPLPVTESLAQRLVSLPSSPTLSPCWGALEAAVASRTTMPEMAHG